MKYSTSFFCLLAASTFLSGRATCQDADVAQAGEATAETVAEQESNLLTSIRQITFAGRRAGEGYFDSEGTRMVFQSERDPSNPFYQIYVTDLETGDVERISPGTGKTTCAWIHPDGDRILFASTHHDPGAREKQEAELELRASGEQRRYSWDYDKHYDLFRWDQSSGALTRLTDAVGYDAEASYSPDGEQIVFASNRAAYQEKLTEREEKLFEVDPAFMMDLYIMDADGTNVRQLTDVPGYDGGPFFSPDGRRICWRRFSQDGATAEVYTMKTDGTEASRLTDLGAMSWAPFFHPSGDYLIFTTNKHGFGNFELYLVRADGQGQPIRVTYTDGFDGLPVFLPGGDQLSWTSTRTPKEQSQIFLADWNDAEARRLLGLDAAVGDSAATGEFVDDVKAAEESIAATAQDFRPGDTGRHVDYLTRPELGGRLTGTAGERKATAYVAAYLESLGLEPAGEEGTFFQNFEFPAGSSLTDPNELTAGGADLELGSDWTPLAFSTTGRIDEGEVVFAGYGMVVPGGDEVEEYDSYVHLDVQDKWVVVLRDLPQDITPDKRQQLARYSAPQRKAAVARDRGAKGIIFVAGPTSQVKRELIRFDSTSSGAGVSIGVVSVVNEVAERWFQTAGKNLADVQKGLDDGSIQMGFVLTGVKVGATINIDRKTGTGRNVIARLPAADASAGSEPVVILGAHIDHLGRGAGGNSLARDDEQEKIHVGADDNASGVAAMLEVAQYLAAQKRAGKLPAKRDLLIAAWSGEELGLFGSQAFVSRFDEIYPRPAAHSHAHGEAHHGPDAKTHGDDDADAVAIAHAHGASPDAEPLTDRIAVYLNLDMVGRLRESLVIQGIGSSPGFEAEVQRRNVPVGLSLKLDPTSTRLPTDASAFVGRGVPILSGFTGAHEDYHTPRDTADKLNYEGIAQTANLFGLLARGYLVADETPAFELDEGEQPEDAPRARLTAYLGTIPDYASGDIKGVKLSGVAAEGPAAKAGLKGGDVIIEVAGKKIENLYDYTYAIEALKIGEEIEIKVVRGDEQVSLDVTPGSRD